MITQRTLPLFITCMVAFASMSCAETQSSQRSTDLPTSIVATGYDRVRWPHRDGDIWPVRTVSHGPDLAGALVPSAVAGVDVAFIDEAGVAAQEPLAVCWSLPFERCRPVHSFASYRGQRSFFGSLVVQRNRRSRWLRILAGTLSTAAENGIWPPFVDRDWSLEDGGWLSWRGGPACGGGRAWRGQTFAASTF
jgi:hypothetical protein